MEQRVQLRQLRSSVRAGSRVRLGRRVTFDVMGGTVILGDDVNLTQDIIVSSQRDVMIGDRTMVAEFVSIRDSEHLIGDGRVRSDRNRSAPIRIGQDVWIGRGVYIGPGVTIGDGAVIAANSIVRESVPAHTLVGGTPARMLRQLA